jgi:16S rRNA (guanine527-N7)-methyltransferase
MFHVEQLAPLLAPYLDAPLQPAQLQQLAAYLDLLLKWNARINLTSIRAPEEIVRRHFGESLFAARHLPAKAETLMDFGSGGGFPGLPIQIFRPEIAVTLAEAHVKKAGFLNEVARTMGIRPEIYSARVELMPAEKQFDVITLRAVEKMHEAIPLAAAHLSPGGTLLMLTTQADAASLAGTVAGFCWLQPIPIPESENRVLLLGTREEQQ